MINLFNHKIKVIRSNLVFKMGKFKLFLANLVYTRFDGRPSANKWLIFERSDSVAVLLYRKVDNKICLVEQLRPATILKDSKFEGGGGLLEVIAGTMGLAERPLDCLYREVAEEVGRLIKNVRLVTNCYMSPGASSEKIAIYLAEDDGSADLPGGGLEAEGEDIRTHWVSIQEAFKMLKNGEIADAKTILAIQAFLLEEK